MLSTGQKLFVPRKTGFVHHVYSEVAALQQIPCKYSDEVILAAKPSETAGEMGGPAVVGNVSSFQTGTSRRASFAACQSSQLRIFAIWIACSGIQCCFAQQQAQTKLLGNISPACGILLEKLQIGLRAVRHRIKIVISQVVISKILPAQSIIGLKDATADNALTGKLDWTFSYVDDLLPRL